MTADVTRKTFDPADGFTAVLAQQGRVMLDADHNEQVDIARHDTRGGRRDIVGRSGAPADAPGFAVTVDGNVPTLEPGRFHLDGLRLENPARLALDGAQPFLPGATLPAAAGLWLAYLEAWEEPVTAVEAPRIREVALGGPDTTTRERLVWQVRWLRLGDGGGSTTCAAAAAALAGLAARFDGTLEPQLDAAAAAGPCIVSEAAQFRGLENQLYRIEIHRGTLDADGAPAGAASFKWSRDNGAVAASAVSLVSAAPILLAVDRLGPGGAEGLDRGAMIEIAGDDERHAGRPGVLARIEDVSGDTLRLSLLEGAAVGALQAVLGGTGVLVRRWDGLAPQPVVAGGFATIEHGLQVRFSGGGLRTGDCWLVPARTAVVPGRGTQLDWPSVGGVHDALPSQAPARHRTHLAVLELSAALAWSPVRDCRAIFPPLTGLLALAKAGGEGQAGAPLDWLPAPLTVLALRGSFPAAGVALRFSVVGGDGGTLSAATPSAPVSESATVDVVTDPTGTAAVFWRLGPAPGVRDAAATFEPLTARRVEVFALGPDGLAGRPAQAFTAQVLLHRNLAMAGGDAQYGRPGERLEVALRVRVDEGARPIANAVVEFAVLNTAAAGQPLDQNSGGNLLASARFVSGVPWPGGAAYQSVRTTTDDDGVAQVQWTLGTAPLLTTQRVEARLIARDDGQPTAQRVLFTAQVAVAEETAWRPTVPWLAGALGAANRNVQAAIDALALRVEQLAIGGTGFDPFIDLQLRRTDNQMAPLTSGTAVLLAEFAAISFREDMIPAGRDVATVHPHGGVVVSAEINGLDAAALRQDGFLPSVRLIGNLRPAATGRRWEWTLSSEARGSLNALPNATGLFGGRVVLVRIAVVPRWLPGGLPTDTSLCFEAAFPLIIRTQPGFVLTDVIRAEMIRSITRGELVIRNS